MFFVWRPPIKNEWLSANLAGNQSWPTFNPLLCCTIQSKNVPRAETLRCERTKGTLQKDPVPFTRIVQPPSINLRQTDPVIDSWAKGVFQTAQLQRVKRPARGCAGKFCNFPHPDSAWRLCLQPLRVASVEPRVSPCRPRSICRDVGVRESGNPSTTSFLLRSGEYCRIVVYMSDIPKLL